MPSASTAGIASTSSTIRLAPIERGAVCSESMLQIIATPPPAAHCQTYCNRQKKTERGARRTGPPLFALTGGRLGYGATDVTHLPCSPHHKTGQSNVPVSFRLAEPCLTHIARASSSPTTIPPFSEQPSSCWNSGTKVVAAVGRGDDAVSAVARLDPDFAVFDVAMPGISGLQAASLVRDSGSRARPVLFSGHLEDEIVHAGLKAGARGFVVKNRMHLDLVSALEHVGAGRAFFPRATALVGALQAPEARHALQLHRTDNELFDAVTELFLSAWRAGHALVAVALQHDLDQLSARLASSGIDLAAAAADARFTAVDTAAALEAISINGTADEDSFVALFGPLIERASLGEANTRRHVTAFGSIAPVLAREGKHDEAHHVEEIANRFLVGRPLSILCPCQAAHHADLSTLASRSGARRTPASSRCAGPTARPRRGVSVELTAAAPHLPASAHDDTPCLTSLKSSRVADDNSRRHVQRHPQTGTHSPQLRTGLGDRVARALRPRQAGGCQRRGAVYSDRRTRTDRARRRRLAGLLAPARTTFERACDVDLSNGRWRGNALRSGFRSGWKYVARVDRRQPGSAGAAGPRKQEGPSCEKARASGTARVPARLITHESGPVFPASSSVTSAVGANAGKSNVNRPPPDESDRSTGWTARPPRFSVNPENAFVEPRTGVIPIVIRVRCA